MGARITLQRDRSIAEKVHLTKLKSVLGQVFYKTKLEASTKASTILPRAPV